MRRWGWGLALAWAAGAWAATAQLPPGAVLIDAATPKTGEARVANETFAVLDHVARGDDAAALARLARIDDPLAQELTAARVVDALSLGEGGDELLEGLERVAPRVFMRHPETAADWFVPVFDIAAKARSLRTLRARRAEATALRAQLMSAPARAIARDDAALVEAIGLLPDAAAADLAARAARGELAPGKRALVALAARSRDTAAWQAALRKGAPEDVFPLFETVARHLSKHAARDWLLQATHDPRYASAAVLALGRAGHDVRPWLDDPDHGPSAAQALARGGDAFLPEVDALVAPQAPALQVRHVALTLRLIDTAAARARLKAMRDDERLPARLRRELDR